MPGTGVKGLNWLNANEGRLEKFAGRWITFFEEKGMISSGATLEEALKNARLAKGARSPYVFKVPSQKELETFDFSVERGKKPA